MQTNTIYNTMCTNEITFNHVLPQVHHVCIYDDVLYHRYSNKKWVQVWVGKEYPVKNDMMEKLEDAFNKYFKQ
jgi:hypothetical protein